MSRLTLAPLLAGLLALTACSSAARPAGDAALPQRPAAAVTVTLVSVPGLGRVLADGAGQVLYMFPPDASRAVTCTGACAGTWPPLAIASGSAPLAAGGASSTRLGTLPDPNTGGRVVTYAGHPLYRYAGDLTRGAALGQALNLNGGPWYVLDASGRPLTQAVS